jgi:hypothetical protein
MWCGSASSEVRSSPSCGVDRFPNARPIRSAPRHVIARKPAIKRGSGRRYNPLLGMSSPVSRTNPFEEQDPIYVSTSLPEIYDAMVRNDAAHHRNPIRAEVFEMHARTFESPTADERPLVYDRTAPVEE